MDNKFYKEEKFELNKKIIGKLIRKARLSLDWTMDELAEKANITPNYLGQIERGFDVPAIIVFVNIANALNVSIDYLLDTNLEVNKQKAEKLDKQINDMLNNLNVSQKEILYNIINSYDKS